MRRVALLGGSSAFTPALASALCARARDLPALELAVHGRDAGRADAVAGFCDRHARMRGAPHRYRGTTDAEDALAGADVVVCQVRAGGYAGRSHDEVFPLAFDLPGDETIGPGGLAAAIRGAPLVRALAEASLRVAPRAWFLQLANPMSVLLAVLRDLDGLRAFGLCELPGDTLARALALVGLARADVDVDYAGLNHRGFFHRVERDGVDLLPALGRAIAAQPAGHFFRVEAEHVDALGALPLPYLELCLDRPAALRRMRARRETRGAELARLSARLHERYAAGASAELPAELAARSTPWYEQSLVPALVALLGGPEAELYVSEPNRGHLDFLPRDAIVEKRARVGAAGPRAAPLRVPPSQRVAGMLAAFQVAEERCVAAALDPRSATVMAALLSEPPGVAPALAEALVPHVLAPVEVAS
jgi:6-phospho-beta-glucosidase